MGRPRVLSERLAEGLVLGLAVRREPARLGGEEGERRRFVLAVLGEVARKHLNRCFVSRSR